MAPLPTILDFLTSSVDAAPDAQPTSDANDSPVELDLRSPTLEGREIPSPNSPSSTLSPIEAHDLGTRTVDLFERSIGSTYVPGQGTQSPDSFNNAGIMALFAIIGASMVVASIWFFFWAKNGGFHYREGDWEDYKSTVLRRKGPDGRTLSNATKSTKLGGSTIAGTQHYKWARQAARSVVSRDEKGRKGILAKRGWGNSHSVTYSDEYTTADSLGTGTETATDEMTEVRSSPDLALHNHRHAGRHRDRDVHEYKRERPARVGGLNRVADGSTYATTNTEGSEVHSEAASEEPLVRKQHRDRERERERAERKAREEAAKMERRWKKEAEEAAAALARESAHTAVPKPKKSAKPAAASSYKPLHHRDRDFSYPAAAAASAASDVLSTAYTATSGQRSASYYDEYRPRAAETSRHVSDHHRHHHPAGSSGSSSRQSSPTKQKKAKAPRAAGPSGGYRRGADSDLD